MPISEKHTKMRSPINDINIVET